MFHEMTFSFYVPSVCDLRRLLLRRSRGKYICILYPLTREPKNQSVQLY
jgi:hypothetical protein